MLGERWEKVTNRRQEGSLSSKNLEAKCGGISFHISYSSLWAFGRLPALGCRDIWPCSL